MVAKGLSPILRDASVFIASLAMILAGILVAVTYGVTFQGPNPGVALWAVVLLILVFAAFGASAVWWYYVYADEREPARGEFTAVEGERWRTGASGPWFREGRGSYRTKWLRQGVLREPEARLSEPGFVPRTRSRWAVWFLLVGLALVAAALLVVASQGSEDPLPLLLVATGLLGGATVLGAVSVGEMSHSGPWARREAGP